MEEKKTTKLNKLDELIKLNRQLVEDTSIIKKEIVRIRCKMESNLYKVATKYKVIDNNLLVVKNQYRGSIKVYTSNEKKVEGYVDFY